MIKVIAKIMRRLVMPIIPSYQRLSFEWMLRKISGTIEPELIELEKIGPNKGIAIDIGANEGIFSYRLSKLYNKVIAFEPNVSISGHLLEYAKKSNVEFHGIGLSDSSGVSILHIPIKDGRALHGWSSLHRDNLAEAHSHIELSINLKTLDSFEYENIAFIKIDVEGHELALIKGAVNTLNRCKPVLLIEVKEVNLKAIDQMLQNLGFKRSDRFSFNNLENKVYYPTNKIISKS